MKKLVFVTLAIFLGLSLKAHAGEGADPEMTSDVQLDSMFESEQKEQLSTDSQYVAAENVKTEKDLSHQKSQVKALAARNEQLNDKIRGESKMVRTKQSIAQRENSKATQLERQVAQKEKQLEQIKIRNVELRKSIELAQSRARAATIASNKAERARSAMKAQTQRLMAQRKSVSSKRVAKHLAIKRGMMAKAPANGGTQNF